MKKNTTFDMLATIWDEALDKAATKGVLLTYNWDCFIYLSAGEGNLTGMTNVTVSAGLCDYLILYYLTILLIR